MTSATALKAYNGYLALRPDAQDYAPWREDGEQVRREPDALAIEQNDRWRHHRWIVEPTFIEEERPVRRTA